MKNQSSLVEEFKEGATQGRASNMFIEYDTLYSYGKHFPLVVRCEDNEMLVNGDKYSISTSRHQNQCFNLGPQVPFSALRSAGIPPRQVKLIDSRESDWIKVPDPLPDDPNHVRMEHRLGSVVLEYQNAHYLSSFDENEPWYLDSYFLCQLPQATTTVDDAYRSLVPQRVKHWQESQNKRVLRQGEWYFLPTERKTRELPQPTTKHAAIRGSTHYATESREDGDLYVHGTVKHHPPFYRNPQHRRLSLGKSWHIVEKNLAVAS